MNRLSHTGSSFYPTYLGVVRGLAAAIGLFALLNVLGDAARPGFDANIWWIDLRPLPKALVHTCLMIAGVLLVWHALRPAAAGLRRSLTVGIVCVLAVAASLNALNYYRLVWQGVLHAGPMIPLSLPIAGALLMIAKSPKSPKQRGGWWSAAAAVCVLGIAVIFGSLGLMWTFGKADYRRPADAVVVFGCRAYADGRPSDALADRVNTAIALYRQGYADTLVMSGGPGDGVYHETEVMRRMALDAGIPDNAVLLDRQGLNTEKTVANTVPLLARHGHHRVLTVSHGYHLPRVKLAYQRAGVEVYTVPAKETYLLTQLPYNMAREVAAWWYYYAKPLMMT